MAAMSAPAPHNGSREVASGLGETLGHSLIERIGNTPLLRLDALTADLPGVALLGKAEWYNPGGSVKDRAAANIVAEARRRGQLGPGKILLDATSGNTGIAYAMLGAAEGFPVTLCMPENVSRERKQILQGYGANILYTDPGDGSDGAIRMARELCGQASRSVFLCRPVFERSQLEGSLSRHSQRNLAADPGTHHAFRFNARYERNFCRHNASPEGTESAVQCISLQPDSSFHGIEGAKHMASAIVPKIYDPQLADRNLEIATEDAYAMARQLSRNAGLLVGISAAAAVVGCLKIARDLPQKKKGQEAVLVTILCDSGDKYLSERFWTEG